MMKKTKFKVKQCDCGEFIEIAEGSPPFCSNCNTILYVQEFHSQKNIYCNNCKTNIESNGVIPFCPNCNSLILTKDQIDKRKKLEKVVTSIKPQKIKKKTNFKFTLCLLIAIGCFFYGFLFTGFFFLMTSIRQTNLLK